MRWDIIRGALQNMPKSFFIFRDSSIAPNTSTMVNPRVNGEVLSSQEQLDPATSTAQNTTQFGVGTEVLSSSCHRVAQSASFESAPFQQTSSLAINRDHRTQNTSTTSETSDSDQQQDRSLSIEVPIALGPSNTLSENELLRSSRGTWAADRSAIFACFSCVIGIYNISRFSLLVYVYKACFIVEFIILTCMFGFPFMYLQSAVGQYLGSGITDMWYISPAFKGVGVALVYVYVVLGVYTSVPISWLFLFFKDSFVTTRETYRWGQCNPKFGAQYCLESRNKTSSGYFGWSVPNYFHGRVLARNVGNESDRAEIKFEITLNLAIIWLLVFASLSQGLRLYGKLAYAFVVIPVPLLILMASRMMEEWGNGVSDIFYADWKAILSDSVSWQLASREVFLTWVLYGGVVLQLCSHNKITTNITKIVLVVGIAGTLTLIMSSFFIVCAIKAISARNMTYVLSSYVLSEAEETVKCLEPSTVFQKNMANVSPINLVIGDMFPSSNNQSVVSGYQVLRIATEILPATLKVQGVRAISSVWSICFFFMMIFFGFAQLVPLWFLVVESIISIKPTILRRRQTIITFIACVAGLLLGLPMTSTIGIFILFYLDYCIGSLWCISIVYLIMLIAILFVRGRFFGTDKLITMVTRKQSNYVWLLPFLKLQWNVVLPVTYVILSVSFWKTGYSAYMWTDFADNYDYWAPWLRKLSLLIQVIPLLIIVGTTMIQGIHYVRIFFPQPFHEIVQSWCCPAFTLVSITSEDVTNDTLTTGINNSAYEEDPPPKYTPPPSYSTATARIMARFINQNDSSISTTPVQRYSSTENNLYSVVGLVSFNPYLENDNSSKTSPCYSFTTNRMMGNVLKQDQTSLVSCEPQPASHTDLKASASCPSATVKKLAKFLNRSQSSTAYTIPLAEREPSLSSTQEFTTYKLQLKPHANSKVFSYSSATAQKIVKILNRSHSSSGAETEIPISFRERLAFTEPYHENNKDSKTSTYSSVTDRMLGISINRSHSSPATTKEQFMFSEKDNFCSTVDLVSFEPQPEDQIDYKAPTFYSPTTVRMREVRLNQRHSSLAVPREQYAFLAQSPSFTKPHLANHKFSKASTYSSTTGQMVRKFLNRSHSLLETIRQQSIFSSENHFTEPCPETHTLSETTTYSFATDQMLKISLNRSHSSIATTTEQPKFSAEEDFYSTAGLVFFEPQLEN
ncbi:sodium-dependent transporter bedraggled-like [Tachypleus tridentatus]|uniref:sodium-dependent transporter bedraggled-like n=1 Tax=Tachypleus tridentatus TaxID=6853 RepID=UPI003FCEFF80